MRTKGETIDEPAERFHAESKVSIDFLSEGEVRIIMADVNPITDVYNDSGRPPE